MTMEYFRYIMEIVGTGMDGVGVLIVVSGAIVATARLVLHRMHSTGNYYSLYRRMWDARFCSVSSFLLLATSSGPSLSRRHCKTCSFLA